jgi:glycosyltransferase involved in cell wall biosynthesis
MQSVVEYTREAVARPLRVLLVAPSLDILGGQAVQAARLLARMCQDNRLKIAFQPINPRLPGLLGRLQKIKYVRTIVTSMLYIAMLLARSGRYDVIHIFSASYLSFLLAPTPAILIARLYGKKVVLNYRSGEAEDHLKRWRKTTLPMMRRAHVIAAPSGYLVDVFARFGLAACSIHNIVETERFRFRKRDPLRPVFMSNRNLEPLYNVDCLLRAFALIQQRLPEARLTLAGDGSQRHELERLAEGLELRNVTFVGRIPQERVHELYDSADIYLNSSDIDNMPGSLIEAFACGLPVVTTDAGGIPYIVTHEKTGLLVPRGDHAALALAAIRLLDEPGLALRIIHNARDECHKYTWPAVRNQWVALYYSLVVEKKTTGDEHR